MFWVHPGTKFAAQEGHRRSLKRYLSIPADTAAQGRESADFTLQAVLWTVQAPQAAGTRAHRLSRAQGTLGGGPCARVGAGPALEYRWVTFRAKMVGSVTACLEGGGWWGLLSSFEVLGGGSAAPPSTSEVLGWRGGGGQLTM